MFNIHVGISSGYLRGNLSSSNTRALATKSLSKTRENWQFDVLMECRVLLMVLEPKPYILKITKQLKILWVKLKVIYNPVKHFAHQFIPGYDPMREHEVTAFSMNYREY